MLHIAPPEMDRYNRPVVYVGMSGDLPHAGHVGVLRIARAYAGEDGTVIVGLCTDEAIKSFKRAPIMSWNARCAVFSEMRSVDSVVPQTTAEYDTNLRAFKPDFVVHGDDWKTTQPVIRQKVIDMLAEWGGTLIEPPYTQGIGTTGIIETISERLKKGSE